MKGKGGTSAVGRTSYGFDDEQSTTSANTAFTSEVASASGKDFVVRTTTWRDLNLNLVKLYTWVENTPSVTEHEHAFHMKKLLNMFDNQEADRMLLTASTRFDDEQPKAQSISSNKTECVDGDAKAESITSTASEHSQLSSVYDTAHSSESEGNTNDLSLPLNHSSLSNLKAGEVKPKVCVETSQDDETDVLELFGDSNTPTDRASLESFGLMAELKIDNQLVDPPMKDKGRDKTTTKRGGNFESPPNRTKPRKSLTQTMTDATRRFANKVKGGRSGKK